MKGMDDNAGCIALHAEWQTGFEILSYWHDEVSADGLKMYCTNAYLCKLNDPQIIVVVIGPAHAIL